MKNGEKFGFLLMLLLYNISIYFLLQISYFLTIIINSVIILLLGYVNVLYTETVLDIIEDLKHNDRRN